MNHTTKPNPIKERQGRNPPPTRQPQQARLSKFRDGTQKDHHSTDHSTDPSSPTIQSLGKDCLAESTWHCDFLENGGPPIWRTAFHQNILGLQNHRPLVCDSCRGTRTCPRHCIHWDTRPSARTATSPLRYKILMLLFDSSGHLANTWLQQSITSDQAQPFT